MFRKEKRIFFAVMVIALSWIIIATSNDDKTHSTPYSSAEYSELLQIEGEGGVVEERSGNDIEVLYEFLLSSQTLFTIMFVFVMMVLVVAYLTVWMLLFFLLVKK